MTIALDFDDHLVPLGHDMALESHLQVPQLRAAQLHEVDAILLRRQLWLLRQIAGLLDECGLPNYVADNLQALGDVVSDLFVTTDLGLGWDEDEQLLTSVMPNLPKQLRLLARLHP